MKSMHAATGGSVFAETKLQHLTGYHEAKRNGMPYYIAAEMTNPSNKFTVGDGKEYGGYRNQELMPGEIYDVYFGGKKTTDGVSR